MAAEATIQVQGDFKRFNQQAINVLNEVQKLVDRRPIKLRFDDRQGSPLGRFAKDAGQFEKSLAAANSRIIAFTASLGVIGGVVASFKQLVSATIEVEKKLTDIRVVSDASAESFDRFRKGLFDVARSTSQSFKDVADAAAEFARQGLSIEETLKRTRDASVLARTTGLEFGKSVESITSAVNTFNNELLTSTDIINRLAAVDTRFAVSSRDLAEAISRVSNVAQDAGVSFNELISLVTALQQRTARGGAVIANAFKTIFTRIQRPDTQALFESLGIQTRDLAGETLPAIQILQNLAGTYDKLSDAQRSQVAETTAGVYQINLLKGALQDLNSQYSTFSNALNVANNAQDDAIRKNQILNQTTAALLQNLQTNITQTFSDLGSISLEPVIKNFINALNGLFGDLRELGGTELGQRLGEGISKGIATFLQGPGIALLFVVFGKLLANLGSFAQKSFGDLTGINTKFKEQQQIQQGINALLSSGNSLYQKRFQAAQSIEAKEKIILELLQQQKALAGSIQNIGLANALVGSKTGKKVIGTTRADSFAGGFLPSVVQEKYNVKKGVGGARSFANPVVVPNFNFGGGKKGAAVVNTDEYLVPNYAGTGGTAVFNRDMIKEMGLPSGAKKVMADGYIPSFNISPEYKKQNPLVSFLKNVFGPIAPKTKPNVVVLPNGKQIDITKLNEGGLRRFTKDFEKQYGIPFSVYEQRRALQRSSAPSSVYDPSIDDFVKNQNFRLPIQSGKSLSSVREIVRGGVLENTRQGIALTSGGSLQKKPALIASAGSNRSFYNPLNLFAGSKSSFNLPKFTDEDINNLAASFNTPPSDIISNIEKKLKTGRNSIRLAGPNGEIAEIRRLGKDKMFSLKQQKSNQRFTSSNIADIITQARSLGYRSIGKAGESLGLADGYLPNFANLELLFQRIATIKKYVGLQGKNSLLVKKDTPTYIQDYLSNPDNQEILRRIGINKIRYNSPRGELPGFGLKNLYSSDSRGSTFSLTGEKKPIEGDGKSFNLFRKVVTAAKDLPFDLSRKRIDVATGSIKPLAFPSIKPESEKQGLSSSSSFFKLIGKTLGIKFPTTSNFSSADLLSAIQKTGANKVAFPFFKGSAPILSKSEVLDKQTQKAILKGGVDIFGREEDIGNIPLTKGAVRGLVFNKTASTYDIVESLLRKGILDNNGQIYRTSNFQELELTREQLSNVKGYLKNLGYVPNFNDPFNYFNGKAWIDPGGRLINVMAHDDIERGPFKSLFTAKRQQFIRVQREGNKLFAPGNRLNNVQRRTLQDLAITRGYEVGDDNKNVFGFAGGYNPLAAAIQREQAAGVPKSLIRVDKDNRLKSPGNPLGLAVTNLRDEPGGKVSFGINRSKKQGIDPKTAGIPNFADPLIRRETLAANPTAFDDPLIRKERALAEAENKKALEESIKTAKEQARLAKERRSQLIKDRAEQARLNNLERKAIKVQIDSQTNLLSSIINKGDIKGLNTFAKSNSDVFNAFLQSRGASRQDLETQTNNNRLQRRQNLLLGAGFATPFIAEGALSLAGGLGREGDQRAARGASGVIAGASTVATLAAFGPAGLAIGAIVGGGQALVSVFSNLERTSEDLVASYQKQSQDLTERASKIQGLAEAEGRFQDLINAGANSRSLALQGNQIQTALAGITNQGDRQNALNILTGESDPTRRQEKLGELNAKITSELQKLTNIDAVGVSARKSFENVNNFGVLGRFGNNSFKEDDLKNVTSALRGLTIDASKVEEVSNNFLNAVSRGDSLNAIIDVYREAGASEQKVQELAFNLSKFNLEGTQGAQIINALIESLSLSKSLEATVKAAQNFGRTFEEVKRGFERSLINRQTLSNVSGQDQLGLIARNAARRTTELDISDVFGGNNLLRGVNRNLQEAQIGLESQDQSNIVKLRTQLESSLIEVVSKQSVGSKGRGLLNSITEDLVNGPKNQDIKTVLNNLQKTFNENKNALIEGSPSFFQDFADIQNSLKREELAFQSENLRFAQDSLAEEQRQSRLVEELNKKADIFQRFGGIEGAIDPKRNRDAIDTLRKGTAAFSFNESGRFLNANRSINEPLRAGKGRDILGLLNTGSEFLGPERLKSLTDTQLKPGSVNFENVQKAFQQRDLEGIFATLPGFIKNPNVGKGIQNFISKQGGANIGNAERVLQVLQANKTPGASEAANFLKKEIDRLKNPQSTVDFIRSQTGDNEKAEREKNIKSLQEEVTARTSLIQKIKEQLQQGNLGDREALLTTTNKGISSAQEILNNAQRQAEEIATKRKQIGTDTKFNAYEIQNLDYAQLQSFSGENLYKSGRSITEVQNDIMKNAGKYLPAAKLAYEKGQLGKAPYDAIEFYANRPKALSQNQVQLDANAQIQQQLRQKQNELQRLTGYVPGLSNVPGGSALQTGLRNAAPINTENTKILEETIRSLVEQIKILQEKLANPVSNGSIASDSTAKVNLNLTAPDANQLAQSIVSDPSFAAFVNSKFTELIGKQKFFNGKPPPETLPA